MSLPRPSGEGTARMLAAAAARAGVGYGGEGTLLFACVPAAVELPEAVEGVTKALDDFAARASECC